MFKIITTVAALLSSTVSGEIIDMDMDVSFQEAHSFTQIMEGNADVDKINEFEAIATLASKDDVEADKKVFTFRNMLIYIKAYQGSNQQQHKLLFDTGSGHLWMNGRLCGTCALNEGYIDERKSSSFKFYPALYDLHYGSGSIYGFASYDKMCMQPHKQCANDFSFITVVDSKMAGGRPIPAISGLLGMSPIPYGQSDLFIDQLKKKGTIDQKVFSIFIDFVHQKSMIQFGGYDLKKYAHSKHQKIHWHSLMHKYTWSLMMEGMKLIPSQTQDITKESRKNYATQVYGLNQRILIDSGTSFLLFPTNERNAYIDFINQENVNVTCNYNVVPVCQCKSIQDFPDLHFKIGSQDVFIPREDYIFPHPYEPICYVGMISIGNVPMRIMGLNFFKNYYSVFDQENIDNLRIGFALSASANPRITQLMDMVNKQSEDKKELLSVEETETLVQGSDITSEDAKEVSFSKTMTYSVTSITVFLIALFFGYKKYNQRKVQNIEGSKDTYIVQ